MTKPLQFSYSLIDQDHNCPEACRHLYLLRDFKKTWTVDGGIDAHKVLEARVKNRTPLPAELAVAEPMVQTLERAAAAYGARLEAEVSLGVTKAREPIGFWDAWYRGKYDVLIRGSTKAFLGDWKTGKIREKKEQLELGAMLLMHNEPTVQEVTGVNLWLQGAKIGTPYTFRRDQLDLYWMRWDAWALNVAMRDPAKPWEMRPGPLCAYCPVATCLHYKGA